MNKNFNDQKVKEAILEDITELINKITIDPEYDNYEVDIDSTNEPDPRIDKETYDRLYARMFNETYEEKYGRNAFVISIIIPTKMFLKDLEQNLEVINNES